MKLLQNKSTGEIGCLVCSFEKTPNRITVIAYIDGKRGSRVWHYDTLAELNEKWEDAFSEKPKTILWLDNEGFVNQSSRIDEDYFEKNKEIGNYFLSREEAEKAVEKLKAWKRLKDRGFRFEGIKEDYTRILQQQDPFRTGRRYLQFNKSEDEDWMEENWNDLDLLFGGKE